MDGESFLINPQGQTLINHGAASLVAGLNLTLYKDKTGFINNVTVGGLVDHGLVRSGFGGPTGAAPGSSANGALFDDVFAVSQSVTFGQYWTLSNTYFNVVSNDVQAFGKAPVHLTNCSGYPALVWDEVKLALNDLFTGWPITFNPYVTWYYELQSIGLARCHGVSAACFPCDGQQLRLLRRHDADDQPGEVLGNPGDPEGADLCHGWTVVLLERQPAFGGSSGSVGMFTTGLTAVMPLSWMPAQYGHWYAKAGFQWYDIINTSLQNANAFSVTGSRTCAATQRRQLQQHLRWVRRHRRSLLIG